MKKIVRLLLSFVLVQHAIAQCVTPASPTGIPDTVSCGGMALLMATGSNGNYAWYAQATGGSSLSTAAMYTSPALNQSTTYYVEAVAQSPQTMMPHNTHSSIYTGNVRGYWFVAPTDFTIVGVKTPPEVSGLQNIAIVQLPSTPPTFSATTSTFTTLYLTQNNPATGIIPLNIQVSAGTIIGVLGQAGTQGSYTAGPVSTSIGGQPVTLTRLGMQFPLGTTAPTQLWTEPGGSISRVELYYKTKCSSPRTAVTAVVEPLTISIQSTSNSICAGDSIQLNATGASTYLWNTGQNTASIQVAPTSTTTYNVNGSSVQGCAGNSSISVAVTPSPLLSVSSVQACQNDTVQLIANASPTNGNFLWSNGSTNDTIFLLASSTTSLTLSYSLNGCSSQTSASISVYPSPTVAISSSAATICQGDSVYLSASGAQIYNWNTGSTSASIALSPTMVENFYLVSGIDSNGCVAEATTFVMVNPLPDVNAGPDLQICEGSSLTLNGQGAINYYWNNGVLDGIPFTPIQNAYYTVTGTDQNGCSFQDSTLVTVGGNTSASITATAIDSYFWPLNGQTYTSSGSYTYTIPNSAGCDSVVTLQLQLDYTGITNAFFELIELSPNPSQDWIQLEVPTLLLGSEYNVLDINGTLVLNGHLSSQETRISLDNWASGLYFISVQHDGLQTCKRFVKE
ncbi:MAG: hypothetical protein RLZZ301_1781 [Bacteroidota bacterium]|jgi:hypothetical protein